MLPASQLELAQGSLGEEGEDNNNKVVYKTIYISNSPFFLLEISMIL